jgi:hypothetical protein
MTNKTRRGSNSERVSTPRNWLLVKTTQTATRSGRELHLD